jgi:hypothetical protein
MPVAPAKKNTTPLILAIVGGLVVLCCGGGVVAAIANSGDDPSPTPTAAAPRVKTADPTKADPTPAEPDPTEGPDAPADTETFDMKVGSTLVVKSDDGDRHDVTVRSFTTFKKGCSSFSPEPDNGMYLVVDVLVNVVTGTASVNPLHFTWVGEDGTTDTGIGGGFSGCAKNRLDSQNDLRAGQKRAGQIVFDVASTKGAVEYSSGAFTGKTMGSWKAG